MFHMTIKKTYHKSSIEKILPNLEITPRLLMGKLTVPVYTHDATVRYRLIEQMKQSDKRVTVVIAPAGFGKSMVLSQLYQSAEHEKIPAGWLTLDQRDNDLGRFLVYLNQAASRLLPFEILPPPNIELSGPGQYFGIKNSITSLISKIAGAPNPFYLFIDELEHIQNPEVLDIIQELIDYLPRDKKLIIGSRNIKGLSLSSLELSGQLLRIETSKLRFDAEEARTLFKKQQKPELSEKDIDLVLSRTQGWAAGIRLVLLSLKDKQEPSVWLESLSGSSENIARYLAENVLSKLSEQARTFLINTSILEQLNSDLCNSILERNDSDELLASFEQSNLFLSRISQPLEPGLISYRFHSLFKDFLFQELQRRNPSIILDLNRKAAHWFHNRKRFRLAVEHALCSEDSQLAADMMNECIMGLISVAQMETVAKWVDEIPEALCRQKINIQKAKAYAMISLHRYAEAEDALKTYRELSENSGEDVTQEVLVQLALLHEFSDRHDLTNEEIKQFRNLEVDDPLLASIACNISAYHHIAHNHFEEALASLSIAQKIYKDSESQTWPKSYSYCFEGLIELIHGNLESATILFKTAQRGAQGAARSIASGFISRSLYEEDNVEEALNLIQEHIKTLRDTADIDSIIMSYRLAARCEFMKADHHKTDILLSELGNIGDRRGAIRIKASAWLEKCRFSLLKGDIESAHRYLTLGTNKEIWAVHSGFHLFANEIEDCQTANIRMSIITGHAESTLQQLKELIDSASTNKRLYRRTHLQNLLAQALFISGHHTESLQLLKNILQFCEPHGLVRLLADEPWYLADMLNISEPSLCHISKPYLQKLFCAIQRNNTDKIDSIKSQTFQNPLTPRETNLIKLVSDGRANKEIARLLEISENTVETHLRRINQKLETSNRTQAVSKARDIGVI
jgi:LuxR family transcriptional regulator, maltose regulon positive regulatory protein